MSIMAKLAEDLSQSAHLFSKSVKDVIVKHLARYYESYETKLIQLFGAVEIGICTRPFYVMFEPSLGCDPRTDHEFPKNVYPLFREQFLKLEKESLQDLICLKESQQSEVIKELLPIADAVYIEIQRVVGYIQQQEAVIHQIQQFQAGVSKETVKTLAMLKYQLAFTTHQLTQRLKYGQLYNPDGAEALKQLTLLTKNEKEPTMNDFERFETEAVIKKMQEQIDKLTKDKIALMLATDHPDIVSELENTQNTVLRLRNQLHDMKQKEYAQDARIADLEQELVLRDLTIRENEMKDQLERAKFFNAEVQVTPSTATKPQQTDPMKEPPQLLKSQLKSRKLEIAVEESSSDTSVSEAERPKFVKKPVPQTSVAASKPKMDFSVEVLKPKDIAPLYVENLVKTEPKQRPPSQAYEVQPVQTELSAEQEKPTLITLVNELPKIESEPSPQKFEIEVEPQADPFSQTRTVGVQLDEVEVVNYQAMQEYMAKIEDELKISKQKVKLLSKKPEMHCSEVQAAVESSNNYSQTKLYNIIDVKTPNLSQKQQAVIGKNEWMNKFNTTMDIELQKIKAMQAKLDEAKKLRQQENEDKQAQLTDQLQVAEELGMSVQYIAPQFLQQITNNSSMAGNELQHKKLLSTPSLQKAVRLFNRSK